jgi:hypothetical protein
LLLATLPQLYYNKSSLLPLGTIIVITPRSAIAYLALLAGIFHFFPGAKLIGSSAVILVIALEWRHLRRVPRVVFAMAGLAALYAWVNHAAMLKPAVANMLALTSLILSVTLLSSVLGRTRDLQRISVSLFDGKPSRRYLSLAFGTTLLAIPINVGSVGVIGSLVAERIRRTGDSAATRNATRAVLRGFGAAPIFSPLSISLVMTLTLLPDLSSFELLAWAIPCALLISLSGLLWREQEVEAVMGTGQELAGWAEWVRFALIILIICIGVFAGSHWLGLSYAYAVALSCLAVVVSGHVITRVKKKSAPLPDLSHVGNELAIVGGSAFIGAVISTGVINIVGEINLGFWWWPLVAAAVPWLFFALGLVGVNPILTGTIVAGILGTVWPTDGLLGLGIGIVTGWGITAFGTPYAANALLMERLSGYSAQEASWRWNRAMSFFTLLFASLLAATLTLTGIWR